MKIKTSLYIEKSIWREIKKAAIDAGQNVGDFIASLFTKWRCERDGKNDSGHDDKNDSGHDRKPTD